jgi:hypothetical protein
MLHRIKGILSGEEETGGGFELAVVSGDAGNDSEAIWREVGAFVDPSLEEGQGLGADATIRPDRLMKQKRVEVA